MNRITVALVAFTFTLAGCASNDPQLYSFRFGNLSYGVTGGDIGPEHTMYALYNYTNGANFYAFENFETGEIKGYYERADGTLYMGDRVQSHLEGNGVMIRPDFTYYGQWKDSRWNGDGMIKWTDGTIYIGSFSDNQVTGEGCMWFTNGNVYAGSFINGQFDGGGTYYWVDQNLVAIGQFIEGRMVHTNAVRNIREMHPSEAAQPPITDW